MQPNENFLIVLENQNCQPISGQDTYYSYHTSYILRHTSYILRPTSYILHHLYHCLLVVAITCKQGDQLIGVDITVPQAAEVV